MKRPVEADFECLSGRKRMRWTPHNRKFVEAVIWIGKNGGRWRCLPEEYRKWGSIHKRFKRWSDNEIQTMGFLQMIFNTFVEDADTE